MLVSKSVINKVINFIKNKELLSIDDNCLLAVSGGFDSTVLIDIISKIKNLFKINSLSIAHINYNLRGEDSINDQIFVEKLCQKYNFKNYTLNINLNSYLASMTKADSLENVARQLRYEFFEKIAQENNYNKIILAHNANDNAETVLLKLIRGTVSGIKGIESQRDFSQNNSIKIIRPLLCLSRDEIEIFAQENNLNPRSDLSNLENDYTRNRIRNNFLPFILKENPNFLESISQTGEVFNKEDKYLDKLANKIIFQSLISSKDNQIIISYNQLMKNDDEILGRVIKNIFFKLRKDKKSFSYKNIEAIKSNLKNQTSKKIIELPDNYFFLKDRDYLIFSKGSIDLSSPEFSYILDQQVLITEVNLMVEIKKINSSDEINIKPDKANLAFSTNKLESIEIKNYNESEKFIPFGKVNTSTIKEMMDKAKVPELIRKDLLMIYINGTFLGIPDYLRSNSFLFKNQTENYCFIFKP